MFNNKIRFHLQGYNWNLAPIAKVIWQSKIQTHIKILTMVVC